ncbi:MAG: DNA polymerase III subunit alpha [Allisonella histaminiformans]|uniref:DNA polymerase III subunit alpha n=1 Tax=Allisonella histaminiformans TaxID=209880 RepID=UPI002A7F5BBF|nr:DNA polymerase III subunit alpha [Allisonella histaminiformans]MDY3956813.1 DNA polymerase III subunit alpha [Allisonella histaminiformans]MDY4539945.1 DNA polymerase III subunit alpha [Allisonella histaminiformans]
MDPFVHLHTHTEYSLFDGISRIPDLVAHVKEMGQTAIAITDHGSMYGAVYLYNECKKQGIKPIIGCEIYITQNSRFQVPPGREKLYHLILLAENNEGYHNLVKICSRAWTEGFHNKPRADHDLLRKYHKGLIALSACVGGELPQAILSGDMDKAHEVIKFYIDTFGRDNYFIELQNHRLPEEARVRPVLADLAKEYGLGLVATNDFHYVRKEDAASQEIKLCISTGKTLDDPEHFHFANDEFYCKSGEEMRSVLGGYEGAIENTARIAERCNVTFTFGEHKLPAFDVPEGETAKTYLRKLCEKAIPERYGQKTPEVMNRLNYELGIIDRMGFSDYFLIVMDFIHFAKTHGIPIGPGRGSAAGSIVSYLLHITELDPLEFDLLFERFLNPERVSMPDIDTDLCYRGRGRVIDYLAHKYGEDHVAQIITFSTLAARAVIRDVGRVMNLPLRDVDKIAKMIPQGPGVTLEKTLESSHEFKSAYETNPTVHTLIDHCLKLEGLSRQAGTHAAGVVICSAPVDDFVPIQLTQENFIQTQYEKDQVEKLGLLKMDLLGLRNLTVIQDTVDMIKENRNIDLDVRKIPYKDKATSEMLCQGDTIGVFQSESSGYTNLLMQLAPDAFQDLIPMVALYRPGPLGSGMAEDFIKRKHGKIPVEYPHPMLEPVLKETYGVILYQEQVMRIASVMGGFSLGQADLLRRAMGHKESDVLLAQRQAFLEGAEKQGVSSEVANHVFDLMVHFAGYGFNKSHSVCYAWIAWQTAYLKAHFRPEFMAAMMTCYNGDRGKVSRYIANSRKHGVKLVAPNVNRSRASFAASGNTILFGLSGIQHLGDAAVESIIEAREKDGPFTSLSDFLERVDGRTVNARACESLIKCGALDDLGANRPQMLEALPQAMSNAAMVREDRQSGQISLFGQSEPVHEVAYKPLPDASAREKIDWERQLLGFYVSGHPLDRFKNEMKQCVPLSELEGEGRVTLDGKLITVGGIINHVKGMVTKKGAPMGYITLEDFTGEIEVVVFPSAWEKYRELLRNDAAILLSGRVQANERTVHILAERIALLDDVKQRKEDQIAQRGHIRALHLYLDEWHESAEVSRQLAVILKRHHGQIPVFLHMERTRKKITMNEQFANDGSVASENALKLLLGNGAVEYDKEND